MVTAFALLSFLPGTSCGASADRVGRACERLERHAPCAEFSFSGPKFFQFAGDEPSDLFHSYVL